jgi:hypothetical protein
VKPVVCTFPRFLKHHINSFSIVRRTAHYRHPIIASAANAECRVWIISRKPFLKLRSKCFDCTGGQLLGFIDSHFHTHKSPLFHTEPVTGILKHLFNYPRKNRFLRFAGIRVDAA